MIPEKMSAGISVENTDKGTGSLKILIESLKKNHGGVPRVNPGENLKEIHIERNTF